VAIITIARQMSSGGDEVAARVASQLGFTLVDRPYIERLAGEHGLAAAELPEAGEEAGPGADEGGQAAVHEDLVETALLDLAEKEDLVILGRGGQFLFAGCPGALHVRIVASPEFRCQRLMEAGGIGESEARSRLADADRERAAFVRDRFGKDWADPVHYDLVIRVDVVGVAGAVRLVLEGVGAADLWGQGRELPAWLDARRGLAEEGAPLGERFMHPSEAELARVLDFYRLRWEYEPRSFPIAWDDQGRATEAFTPDFYLPDLDLYIELTTLKQSLVTDKNRKVRRLRELYPDVKLKIFYGRDYRSLLHKYGRPPTEAPAR
jgi:cytidylate kinase